MAADRATKSLMISLIIFVMISFILALTTYFGFQQRGKERQAAETARSDMEKANHDRDIAKTEAQRLRDVLGTDKDTAEAVETERNDIFDKKFASFNGDSKSFLRLVEWLDNAVKTKDEQLQKLDQDFASKIAALEDAVKQAQTQQRVAEQAHKEAQEDLEKVKADFQKRREEHDKAQQAMRQAQDEALARANQLQDVTNELTKLGPLLSPDLRRKFLAAAPQGEPEPWSQRVRFVNAELLAREKAIQDLNATLATLRVADPQLQEKVRKAIPDDDRIDGFDGRVAAVNSLDKTVLILCDSTAGMRPGLVLSVYDPDDPRPRNGERKALVEVVEVEGPTLARASILPESSTAPILTNDGVASSLWAPGVTLEIMIVGSAPYATGRRAVRADDRTDGPADTTDPLLAFLGQNGARIVDTVTPRTAMVLDTGEPRAEDLRDESGQRSWQLAKSAREEAVKQARKLGIRVVTLDGLLDMLGLDRASLDGRRLPTGMGTGP